MGSEQVRPDPLRARPVGSRCRLASVSIGHGLRSALRGFGRSAAKILCSTQRASRGSLQVRATVLCFISFPRCSCFFCSRAPLCFRLFGQDNSFQLDRLSVPPRCATTGPLKQIDREQDQNDHDEDSDDGHGLLPPNRLNLLVPESGTPETESWPRRARGSTVELTGGEASLVSGITSWCIS